MNASNSFNTEGLHQRLNRWLAFIVVTVSALAVFSYGRSIDPDFWGQLAFGRLILQGGTIPVKDPFSYMPIKDIWVNHEWGAAVVFYWLYNNFGGFGIMLLKMAVWVSVTLTCLKTNMREGAWPLYVLLIFGVCFSFFYVGVNNRPHLFTYLFFALFLSILQRYETHPNSIFLLPVVSVFWANTHGGIVAGLGIFGLFFFADLWVRGRIDKRIGLALLLSLLAPLINPYGLDYYKYLLPAVFMNRSYISEWQPLNLLDFSSFNNYKVLLGLLTLSVPLAFRKDRLYQYLILVFTVYVSIKHVRHVPFFFIACMAFLPGILTSMNVNRLFESKDGNKGTFTKIRAYVVTLLLLMGLIYSSATFSHRFLGKDKVMDLVTPVTYDQMGGYVVPRLMVKLIKEYGLKGNIAVEFAWGEYLIWTLGDRCKVSIDGRLETVYPEKSIDAYFDFVNVRKGWRTYLYDYPVDMVLIRKNCPVFDKMLSEKEWNYPYLYYDSALFIRKRDLPSEK